MKVFVWIFSKKNGIEIFVERVKIGGERELRKGLGRSGTISLKMYSKEKGLKVALGHNLTDAFETFVFNSLRGSGIRGLIIPPKVRSCKTNNFSVQV